MKKILYTVLAIAFVVCVVFAWGCKPAPSTPDNPTATRSPVFTATVTLTCTLVSPATETSTVTETSTEVPTFTITPTSTTVVQGIWNFEGTLEGWQRTTSVYTAFSDAYYTTAQYDSAPGSAGLDCNFTGTGGVSSQTGRFYIDLTSDPVNLAGKSWIVAMINVPAGMIDQTPPYAMAVYFKTDGGGWVNAGGYSLTTAGGWGGWGGASVTKPGGAMLEGIMYEITKPDGSADFSGTMFIDTIRVF